jgi:hypothetical protein
MCCFAPLSTFLKKDGSYEPSLCIDCIDTSVRGVLRGEKTGVTTYTQRGKWGYFLRPGDSALGALPMVSESKLTLEACKM